MNNTLLANVPSMSISQAADILSNAFISVIKKKLPVTTIPSVMLWGSPGVGKSQGVRQMAAKIAKETKKKVSVTDVRLLLFNPIDLRGIPTANEDKTLAVWLRPQIFNMNPSDKIINVLFLDEISAAPQSVQAAAYQITLDRTVGEHRLPDNCIVIAAGNRVTDKSVAYKMPKALANRLLHIDIQPNFDSWRAWAVEKGINEKIIGFLGFRRSMLMDFDPSTDDLAFATPRSWELVSNILNSVDDSEDNTLRLIGGIIGSGTATEFRTWLRVYRNLPNIESIFNGTCDTIPKGTDALYALSSSMVAYARAHKDDMKAIINSINYCQKLPVEYSVLTLKDYLYIDDELKIRLLKTPEYARWLNEKGAIINAIA